jgi:hypothetical protein
MGPLFSQRKAILLSNLASVNAQHYIKILAGGKDQFSRADRSSHRHIDLTTRKPLVIHINMAKDIVKFR